MSDFSDRPFVAGSLTGVRSFRVDSLGRLTGVHQRTVFMPGENVGECRGMAHALANLQVAMSRSMTYSLGGGLVFPAGEQPKPAPEPKSEPEPTHQVGGLGCACGFYAYFDGDNTYHQHGQVEAVVQGYGVTTVGSRGFRAEKSRLLALVRPGRPGWPFDRLARWVDDKLGIVPIILGCIAISAGLSWTVVAIPASPWYGFSALLPLAGAGVLYLSFRGIFSDDDNGAPVPFDLLRRNYPDVPVYRSLAAALRDFPLTPPPVVIPSPDDDPEFWTRDAQ